MNTATGTRKIGILSGKGGVGKSMLTVNLGEALTMQNKKNILIDADLGNPCLGLHLGLSYTQLGLQDVLQHGNKFGDAVVIQPQTGMRVLPATIGYTRGASLKNLGPVLNNAGKAYEFTIVDSPPGITDNTFNIIEACNELIVVTTPDIPAVSAATKMTSFCRKRNKRVLGVVVNRSTGARYELDTAEIASMTDAPVLARIPEDEAIPESISLRTPAVYYAPKSRASKKLVALSSSLLCGPSSTTARPSIFSGFTSFFKRLFRLK